MNARCFKTVFSEHSGCLVAVGEHACSQGKSSGESPAGAAVAPGSAVSVFIGALVLSMAWVGLAWASPVANALPTGGQVVQGAASMVQSSSPTASQLTINQTSQRAAINWQSFDIGAAAKVNVVQPNAQAVLLNRVVGQSPSQIFGQLQANGHVILVNPNGVLFGKDGSVNPGSFTASTLGISDANFMAGNMVYERNGSTAGVVNQGTIQVSPGGYVALLGASVSNEGKIIAPQGGVALGSAAAIRVPVSGSGRVKLELKVADINASVSNTGQIVSQGGQVYMQALALNQAAAQVIQSGSIDTSGEQGGAVHVLADGGTIKVDGSITANSTGTDDKGQTRKGGDIVIGRDEETGVLARYTDVSSAKLESQRGFVETSGDHLRTDGVSVKAAQWLLDPSDITISSAADSNVSGTSPADITPTGGDGSTSVVSVSTIQSAINAGTSVTIKTTNASNPSGAGNITIANALAFNNQGATDATLSLVADNGITQNAGASITTNAASTQRVHISLTANGNHQGNTAASASSQGVELRSTINTNGMVTISGTNKNTGAGAGVQFSNGASITTTSGSAITVTGTATAGTAYGVGLFNTLIDAGTTGDVSIIGTSAGNHGVHNPNGLTTNYNMKLVGRDVILNGTSSGAGASGFYSVIGQSAGNFITAERDISITGTTNSTTTGSGLQYAKTNWQTLVNNYAAKGSVTLTGSNTAVTNTDAAVYLFGVQASALNAGNVSVNANTQNSGVNAITMTSNAFSSPFGYQGGATSLVSAGGDVNIQANKGGISLSDGVPNSVTPTTISGRNISIDNTGGTIDANTGAITRGAGSGSSGISINDGRAFNATGNINLYGAGTTGSGVAISAAATLSATNITINGENTGTGGAAINISHAQSSLTASVGVTLTSGGTGSGTSLVAAGNISVGTQLRITTPAAGSIAGVISGNGSLLKMGAGQTRLTAFDGTTYGTNIFSGGTTISQGSLLFGNGNGNYNKTAGTGAITLGDVNTGASNVALLIEKGKDSSQESGKLSRAITVTSNGTGTAMIGGATGTGAGWTAINGAITLNRDVIFNDSTSDRLSIDGKITGTGNITLTGYRLTMSSSVQNDFVGSFTVSAGSILQSAANVNLAFAQSHNLIVNGDWRLYSANPSINSLTGSGTVTTYSGSPLLSIGNNNGGGVFSGVMSGALSLTKNGSGTQILSGANSYTGTTTISGGTLQIGNGGTSGALGTGVITNNSALVFNRTDTALVVGAKISGAGTVTQAGTGTTTLSANNDWSGSATVSAGTLQIGNGGTTGTLGTSTTVTSNGTLAFKRSDNISVGQKITGTGGLTQAGTGKVTLMDSASTNGVNDYSGVTTIVAGGTLEVGNGGSAGNLGSGTITDNGSLIINRSDAVAISQVISGTGSLSQSGTGTTTLSGINTYSGGTNVVTGILKIGDGTNNGQIGSNTVDIASGAVVDFNVKASSSANYSTTNTFTGTGTLKKSGAGSLTWGSASGVFAMTGGLIDVQAGSFTGANSNNEVWTNNKASLNVAGGAIFAGVEGNIRVDALTGGGTVTSGWGGLPYGFTVGVNGGSGTFSGSIQNANSQNATLTKVGAGTQILTGNNTYSGTTTISDGVLQVGNGGTTGNLGTGGVINNASLIFNRSNTQTVANAISGSGTLTQSGAGTTILTGSNSYTGDTTISTGTLQVGNGGTSGTLGAGAVVDNASLVFNRSDALLVSSAISGTGTLAQAGAGTTTLAADNSYGGTTAVSGGTLQVGNGGSIGTLGAGAVTLSNNALLSYVRAADTSISNNISGTGSVSASITGTGSDLTVSNAIALTGGTANLAADGNLSVTQGISTTNATTSAVVLNAGKVTNAGTANGGDIQFSGSGSVGVGAGGRATLFTGSLAGSTGLGIATGNNRYNSDEQSPNYTAALSGGIYAIYREAPTLNVRFNDVSKTYNAQAFTGGNGLSVVSGFIKGDSTSTFSSINYSGTAQNASNAGTYAISGTALNSQGYALSYTSGTLTVNKADLVLTGSREYDAGTTFAGQYLTATGVAGQTFSLSGAGDSSNLVSKHVASNQSVALNSVTGLTLGTSSNGGLADNYNAISTSGSLVSLTTKAASVSATETHVTYNGNTQQQLYTSSIISGDVISVSGLGSGTNVGSYTSALSVSGADASNYHFSLSNADLVIDKANLTLSGSRAYDASTTFAGTHLTATGVNNEAFAVSGSGDVSNLSSKHVQTNQLLSSVAGLTVGASTGSNAGLSSNYNDLSTTGSSVSVTPRTLTVTGANTSVTYNGSAQTNAGATIVGKQGSDDFTVGGYGTGTNASITSYADNLSVTGLGNTLLSNYDIHYTQGGLSIGKANLVLSGSRQYDASTTFAGTHLTATGVAGQTFTVMGAGDASNLASQNVQSNQALSSITGLALGSSANGGLVDNYNNISTSGSSVSVTPRTLTVTGANTSVTYNGSAQTNAGATIVGKQGSDDFTVGGYGSGTNASNTSYADNLSMTGVGNTLLSNYDIHYTHGGLSIGKANLVLSGSRQYDASTTFAGQYLAATGVAGETFSVLGLGDASNLLSKNVADNQGVSLNAVTGLNLGTSTNGGLAANYNALSTAGSSVRLTTKALAAAAAVADKVYDGNQLAVLGDLSGSGVVAGDRVIFQATSALFSDKNVSRNAEGQVLDKNVTVSGLSLSGADAGNYALSVNSFTTQAKITPLQLSLQATAQDKTYDGTRAATGHVLWSGVLGADTLAVTWGDVNFVSKDVARSATGQVLAKSVVFSNMQMSGQDAGNYSLPTAPVAALARITPKRLSIDGTSVVNKPQDGNTDAKTQMGRLTGLVEAEQLEVQAMASFDSAMAGSNKPVTVRYRLSDGANGGLGGNYELPDQVLMANIFAPAGGNSVQPIKPPVDGPLVSTDAATATVVQTESRDVCSSATPEKCQCHATSVAGMEICMPGLKNMLPSPPPRGRTFVEASGF